VAGAHNYYMNDSLTRDYLLSFGKSQIQQNIYKTEWQTIVDFAEANIPNKYDYKLSSAYAECAFDAEKYIDSINNPIGGGGGGPPISLFTKGYPFSPAWMLSNVGATYFSNLGDEIIYKEFSSKLSIITTPVLCITGKYDFTVPVGLANEVMSKVSSARKKLVVLQRSGHICMDNEPDNFYKAVIAFIEENK
jgi:pimeloyl-ACP methyl ester carboxylesterase